MRALWTAAVLLLLIGAGLLKRYDLVPMPVLVAMAGGVGGFLGFVLAGRADRDPICYGGQKEDTT